MLLRIKRLFKERNRGVALILSILVISVLFIFTSFLVRRVITNTVMVGKTKDEYTSYTLAREGILYAIDKLNNSIEGNWPGGEGWHEYYDVDSEHEEGGFRIKVIKVEEDKPDKPPSDYFIIQSQDLPKKLVTLEGIADPQSPLLKYVRFINSDATFGHNTFGEEGSGATIQDRAPFCVIGDLTWEGSNNLILREADDKAVVYGNIYFSGTSLTINGNPPAPGFYYYTTPSDLRLFDTAGGHLSLIHI